MTRRGAPLWTPRRGGNLTGWWANSVTPLVTPTVGYAPGQHRRGPPRGSWLRFLRKQLSTPVVTPLLTRQLQRRARQHTPRATLQLFWLTTLTRLTTTAAVVPRRPFRRASSSSWTAWGVNQARYSRRSSFSKIVSFSSRRLSPPVRLVRLPVVSPLTTRRRALKPFRWVTRVIVPRLTWWARWRAQCLSVQTCFFSFYLLTRGATGRVAPRGRRRYQTKEQNYLALPPAPLHPPRRWLPHGGFRRRGGRRRRWRRWYPLSTFWLFKEYIKQPLLRTGLPPGYLGLFGSPGLSKYSKVRWWLRRRRVSRGETRRKVFLSWRKRWSRPRKRWVPRWKRRRGMATRVGTSGFSQQQAWTPPWPGWGLSLRRLTSLTVRVGRRWATERVTRSVGRTVAWENLYRTGYTSVGYRTRRKAGTNVKVPSLLSPAKSLTLLRRWFTKAVATAGGRTWPTRVATAAAAGVHKQQQEFVTTCLINVAVL